MMKRNLRAQTKKIPSISMPLLIHEKVDNCTLGIWQMAESTDELVSLLTSVTNRQVAEQLGAEASNSFTALHRRREWLTVRLLSVLLLGRYVPIDYHPSGRPYLADDSYSISISHSRTHVAVLLGEGRLGIDVEDYSQRVRKVIPRFVGPDEHPGSLNGDDTWGVLLHWCAKEVMYKIIDKVAVDLIKDFHISPFEVSQQGFFIATSTCGELPVSFCMHYRILNDFAIVWCS